MTNKELEEEMIKLIEWNTRKIKLQDDFLNSYRDSHRNMINCCFMISLMAIAAAFTALAKSIGLL